MKQRYIEQRNYRIRAKRMKKVKYVAVWGARICLGIVLIASMLYAGSFELQSLLLASGG